ncbi:MAG: paraquat-inducible protein A [Verrucomicrobiota bacterium]
MIPGFTRRWLSRASWPRPRRTSHVVACHFCDTLHEAPELTEGSAARCNRCDHVLYQNRPASLVRASAFSASALVAMILCQVFPFLTMDAVSIRKTLTLAGTAGALFDRGEALLGIAVIAFTMVAPFLLAAGMLYVAAPLLLGFAAPGARVIVKFMYRSEPWNMAEVYLLAVIVSLLKIAKLADVHFGIGFWAAAALMVLLAAGVAGIDREELWDRLELAKQS